MNQHSKSYAENNVKKTSPKNSPDDDKINKMK